ncbi:hypothetical protein GCM10022395_15410 [Snuella lapsa]|uniref:Uncharacterized protein n=1 Tax=Snuella lapsa TaxID=870481 RepID=A0ABP6XEM5_9FLAO
MFFKAKNRLNGITNNEIKIVILADNKTIPENRKKNNPNNIVFAVLSLVVAKKLIKNTIAIR